MMDMDSIEEAVDSSIRDDVPAPDCDNELPDYDDSPSTSDDETATDGQADESRDMLNDDDASDDETAADPANVQADESRDMLNDDDTSDDETASDSANHHIYDSRDVLTGDVLDLETSTDAIGKQDDESHDMLTGDDVDNVIVGQSAPTFEPVGEVSCAAGLNYGDEEFDTHVTELRSSVFIDTGVATSSESAMATEFIVSGDVATEQDDNCKEMVSSSGDVGDANAAPDCADAEPDCADAAPNCADAAPDCADAAPDRADAAPDCTILLSDSDDEGVTVVSLEKPGTTFPISIDSDDDSDADDCVVSSYVAAAEKPSRSKRLDASDLGCCSASSTGQSAVVVTPEMDVPCTSPLGTALDGSGLTDLSSCTVKQSDAKRSFHADNINISSTVSADPNNFPVDVEFLPCFINASSVPVTSSLSLDPLDELAAFNAAALKNATSAGSASHGFSAGTRAPSVTRSDQPLLPNDLSADSDQMYNNLVLPMDSIAYSSSSAVPDIFSSCSVPVSSRKTGQNFAVPVKKRHLPKFHAAEDICVLEDDDEAAIDIAQAIDIDRTKELFADFEPEPEPSDRCYNCDVILPVVKMSCCMGSCACCAECLMVQVKSTLAGNKTGAMECKNIGCQAYYLASQLRNTLPEMIVEILEERMERDYLNSVSSALLKEVGPELLGESSTEGDSSSGGKKGKEKMRAAAKNEDAIGVPGFWAEMSPTDDYLLIDLDVDSNEYIWVSTLFHETMCRTRFNITRIRRVQNLILWQFYNVKKKEMQRYHNTSLLLNEKHLFHGTTSAVVPAICANNFDWRASGSHGVQFGDGSYFARDASYSHMYTDNGRYSSTRLGLSRAPGSRRAYAVLPLPPPSSYPLPPPPPSSAYLPHPLPSSFYQPLPPPPFGSSSSCPHGMPPITGAATQSLYPVPPSTLSMYGQPLPGAIGTSQSSSLSLLPPSSGSGSADASAAISSMLGRCVFRSYSRRFTMPPGFSSTGPGGFPSFALMSGQQSLTPVAAAQVDVNAVQSLGSSNNAPGSSSLTGSGLPASSTSGGTSSSSRHVTMALSDQVTGAFVNLVQSILGPGNVSIKVGTNAGGVGTSGSGSTGGTGPALAAITASGCAVVSSSSGGTSLSALDLSTPPRSTTAGVDLSVKKRALLGPSSKRKSADSSAAGVSKKKSRKLPLQNDTSGPAGPLATGSGQSSAAGTKSADSTVCSGAGGQTGSGPSSGGNPTLSANPRKGLTPQKLEQVKAWLGYYVQRPGPRTKVHMRMAEAMMRHYGISPSPAGPAATNPSGSTSDPSGSAAGSSAPIAGNISSTTTAVQQDQSSATSGAAGSSDARAQSAAAQSIKAMQDISSTAPSNAPWQSTMDQAQAEYDRKMQALHKRRRAAVAALFLPAGASASNPPTLGQPVPSTSGATCCSEEQKTTTHHTMFLSKVLVGASTLGKYGYRKPPPVNPDEPYGRFYDSCVNSGTDPTVFVIFNSAQCYPEYVLEYSAEV